MEGAVLAAAPKVLSAISAAPKVAGIVKMAAGKGKKIVNRSKSVLGAAKKAYGGIKKGARAIKGAISKGNTMIQTAKGSMSKFKPPPVVKHGAGLLGNVQGIMRRKAASSAPKVMTGKKINYLSSSISAGSSKKSLMGGTQK